MDFVPHLSTLDQLVNHGPFKHVTQVLQIKFEIVTSNLSLFPYYKQHMDGHEIYVVNNQAHNDLKLLYASTIAPVT